MLGPQPDRSAYVHLTFSELTPAIILARRSSDEIRTAGRVQTIESSFAGCLRDCPLSEGTIWDGDGQIGHEAVDATGW